MPMASQSAVAADAQHQFLADADAIVAAVQPGGQLAVFGRVAFDVGIEKQQVAAAHVDAPYLGADRAAAGFHFDGHRLARANRWPAPWATG